MSCRYYLLIFLFLGMEWFFLFWFFLELEVGWFFVRVCIFSNRVVIRFFIFFWYVFGLFLVFFLLICDFIDRILLRLVLCFFFILDNFLVIWCLLALNYLLNCWFLIFIFCFMYFIVFINDGRYFFFLL